MGTRILCYRNAAKTLYTPARKILMGGAAVPFGTRVEDAGISGYATDYWCWRLMEMCVGDSSGRVCTMYWRCTIKR